MPGFLNRLFGRRDRLYRLASGEDVSAFIDALRSAQVTIFGKPGNDGFELGSLDQDAFVEVIERMAKELAAREVLEPFTYEDEGSTCLPFFTTTSATDAFGGGFCSRENRLFQFPAFVLPGSVLQRWAMPGVNLVLNPQSRSEFVLTDAQRAELGGSSSQTGALESYNLSESPTVERHLITPFG